MHSNDDERDIEINLLVRVYSEFMEMPGLAADPGAGVAAVESAAGDQRPRAGAPGGRVLSPPDRRPLRSRRLRAHLRLRRSLRMGRRHRRPQRQRHRHERSAFRRAFERQ